MSNKPIKKSDLHKSWIPRTTSSKPYNNEKITPKKTFLVVCEGENTEPEYLKSIPAPNASIVFRGAGFQKVSLVKEAKRLGKLDEYRGREIWCVFDMDY